MPITYNTTMKLIKRKIVMPSGYIKKLMSLIKKFRTRGAQLVALSISKNNFTAQTQITITKARFPTKRTFY